MNICDYVNSIGVGGIFAVLVIKLVLDFLKDKRSGSSWTRAIMQVDEMHEVQGKQLRLLEKLLDRIELMDRLRDK